MNRNACRKYSFNRQTCDNTFICKINLTLDVLSKRENGYHDIKMIMQTVSLFDLILVDKTHRGISISTNLPYLPCNEKNIAYKAADAFFKATGIRGGAKIVIHKNIPVAAGACRRQR